MPAPFDWKPMLVAVAMLGFVLGAMPQGRVQAQVDKVQAVVVEDPQIRIQDAVRIAVEQVNMAQPGAAAMDDTPADEVAEQGEETPDGPTEQELRAKLQELDRQMREVREQHQQLVAGQRQATDQTEAERIEQAVLPAEPTRADCVAYLDELREATAERRSFSSGDPVVEKLRAVPHEHIDLLIAELSGRTSLRYYAQYALADVDPEAVRQQIVGSLEENPNNIGVIVMNGWCADARPIIRRRIEAADANLEPAWFQAGVELAEPALYEKLHEVTVTSRYALQFINLLRMLPDYDLNRTIDACWAASREGRSPVNPVALAPQAAELGRIDALGVLIERLQTTSSYLISPAAMNSQRAAVLSLIKYNGTNREVQAWFVANKDELVYDFVTGRFVLPEAF